MARSSVRSNAVVRSCFKVQQGKMNLLALDVQAELLIVSQFTDF
jgi:D-Tyr-tRNAtyr deacylase